MTVIVALVSCCQEEITFNETLTPEFVMNFEEVDVSKEKPEYAGWFNMTAECLPRAMGRIFFDGKMFHFRPSQFDFSQLLNDGAKIYWLRGTTP